MLRWSLHSLWLCIQCPASSCRASFHVSCAEGLGLLMSGDKHPNTGTVSGSLLINASHPSQPSATASISAHSCVPGYMSTARISPAKVSMVITTLSCVCSNILSCLAFFVNKERDVSLHMCIHMAALSSTTNGPMHATIQVPTAVDHACRPCM